MCDVAWEGSLGEIAEEAPCQVGIRARIVVYGNGECGPSGVSFGEHSSCLACDADGRNDDCHKTWSQAPPLLS